MQSRFEVTDAKVYLIVEQIVWGSVIEVLRKDVTDEVIEATDICFMQDGEW
jgi:hypothetical protein